jgi:hypothetical protein
MLLLIHFQWIRLIIFEKLNHVKFDQVYRKKTIFVQGAWKFDQVWLSLAQCWNAAQNLEVFRAHNFSDTWQGVLYKPDLLSGQVSLIWSIEPGVMIPVALKKNYPPPLEEQPQLYY